MDHHAHYIHVFSNTVPKILELHVQAIPGHLSWPHIEGLHDLLQFLCQFKALPQDRPGMARGKMGMVWQWMVIVWVKIEDPTHSTDLMRLWNVLCLFQS